MKDLRGRLGDDLDLRRKVLQAFNTVVDKVEFGANGTATLRLVGGICVVKIDLDGNIIGGHASLSLKEADLAKHGDPDVVSLVRAVTHRFAKVYQRGEANWSLDARTAC